MPRFRVNDLLIATTLVATGLGMLVFVATSRLGEEYPSYLRPGGAYFVLGALGLIGAGLGTPFHRPFIGALVVMVFSIIAIFLWVLWIVFTS